MDGLTLLQRARDAGLRVEATGGKLLIRGPKRAEPVVKLLAKYKVEVLAALATPAEEPATAENELIAPTPWFGRIMPPAEGETDFETQCAGRRGRLEERPDGLFLHFCTECGAWGAFGYGANLRTGRLGRWYCAAHRPSGETQ